jgi:chromosome segregation ATPase
MSTEETNDDYPFKSRVWGAIETLKTEVALLEEKFRISERDVLSRDHFYESQQTKWEEIEQQIIQTDKRLIRVEETLTHISNRLDDMAKFPMKTLAFIAALASTATIVWKLIKGLFTVIDNGR